MAKQDGGGTAIDHKRLALEFMPPGELRDGYLEYLDGLELRDPETDGGDPPSPGRARPGGADGGWSPTRVVVAAVGSVAFALGTWAVTSLF